ncbi:MAG: hypothetical protein KDD02_04155 [Phaeodactylibacter sp.]|nr:hypothetical protein [Phaeodactylibacter sp.]MCB9303662.1 hypothetical protein [Lewinellaceae bacterium]
MLKATLDRLKEGYPAISKNIGAYLAEGGAFCLEGNGHKPGVALVVDGDYPESIELHWSTAVDGQVSRSWNDSQEATEYGATAVAIVILAKLTPYTVIERSFKGTGFDYWLGSGEYDENLLPFQQRKAKLEVSGIWKESGNNTVDARVKLKRQQIKHAGKEGLPAFIIVVEFGTPKAKFVKQ